MVDGYATILVPKLEKQLWILLEELSKKKNRILLNKVWLPIFCRIEEILNSNDVSIIGITGPPGIGKTTTAKALQFITEQYLSKCRATILSLEDFYFKPKVRARIGIKWRAMPGSHDLKKLALIFSKIKSKQKIKLLPKYNIEIDIDDKPVLINDILRVVFFEGWLLHVDIQEYKFIKENLCYLIYLDASLADCKKWRFDRENSYKQKNKNYGYSFEKMSKFWNEVLEPVTLKWVLPQKDKANIIVHFDHHHLPDGVIFND